MALSDTTVRQAKATGKDYTIGDSGGLSLSITSEGGKSWHFRYCWNLKQKRLSLGTYPEISLKEARKRRDEARELVARGINPHRHRTQERKKSLLADEHTFQKVFDKWFEHRKLSLKEGRQSTLSQIQRIFNRDILPTLGQQSVFDIKRPDLLDVLEKIERRGAWTTAEKSRTWLHQMFRYALVKVSGLEQSPASDLDVVAAPKPPVTHNPFLRMDELPDMLRTLRKYKGMLQTQLGLRLLFLTGVRTGELRLAEPTQFDLAQGLWFIPPDNVKQLQLEIRKDGKQEVPPYIVPLSVQAIEIFRYLLDQMRPAQKHLLSHRANLKERISENTLNNALHRMGYASQLTGHGIRATISTALNEIGYPKVWVDAQLSHSDPDKVSSSYNHAEYVEPRRHMMQDWADRLDLWERGLTQAAGMRLSIKVDGMALVPATQASGGVLVPAQHPVSEPLVVTPQLPANTLDSSTPDFRLPAVPLPVVPAVPEEPELTPIQRERVAVLEAYEAPHNLPVITFAKLAGKSRDQINRDIKARRLLSLSLGNRGHRIPDWQLDQLRHKLTQAVLTHAPEADQWMIYQALSQPHKQFNGRMPIEAVTPGNLIKTSKILCAELGERSR